MSSPSHSSGQASPPNTPPQVALGRDPTDYVPANPSRLRESHNLSAEDMSSSNPAEQGQARDRRSLGSKLFDLFRGTSQQDTPQSSSSVDGEERSSMEQTNEPSQLQPDARTRLLDSYNRDFACGTSTCGHGTFSPKASSSSAASSVKSFTGRNPGNRPGGSQTSAGGDGDDGQDGRKGMSTTKRLAKEHGVKNHRSM
jgi:hypothetical protein